MDVKDGGNSEVTVNLVVVSNRVARGKSDEPIAGGLAAALLPVVKTSGAIWVGSHCRRGGRTTKESLAEIEALGRGALARVDIPAADYAKFYEGFANSGLWPVLHSRPDLIRANEEEYRSYLAVNSAMAGALLRFRKSDTAYWVHDYHFLVLGNELRRLGVDAPIGFFLHTPFPTRATLLNLPHHRELVGAMLAYDLVGFQTDEDKANFIDYIENELGVGAIGETFFSSYGASRVAAFPIGIDVDAFAERAVKAFARPDVTRLRSSLQGARLAIGVDRVDYSKGLANRFRAIDRMLEMQPSLKGTISMLQIAVPSRVEINTYRALHAELAALVGEINGRHGEADWTPIRYLNKAFGHDTLAGFYRAAHIGLVTPLHDGMNLVAKEYVAAQNPFDPGVLILSEFAGAAKQLDSALIVNPHDIDGVAHAITKALSMPQEERRERWNAMIATLNTSSLSSWFSAFVGALAACEPARQTQRRPQIAAATTTTQRRLPPLAAAVQTH
jgi:trehalose 6-phosphate synthase